MLDDDVRDHLPLQQGLRLVIDALDLVNDLCQRLSSITTRIKTTCNGATIVMRYINVRDYLPLQQGLRRLILLLLLSSSYIVRDYLPLQQGLRLVKVTKIVGNLIIRDHLPLKQGLRLLSGELVNMFFSNIRDHLPLKQGLRPPYAVQGQVNTSETIFH